MGIIDRFEKGVESAVHGAFAKTFRAAVKPVELSAALKRECDDKAAAVDRNRTVAPNAYFIALAPDDYDAIISWGEDAMASELQGIVSEHAVRHHLSFPGKVTVGFNSDPDIASGTFVVTSKSARTSAAPVTVAHANAHHPLIDVNGQRYHLTGEYTSLGRGDEADIVVDDSGVSRTHIRFELTEFGTILTDLQSTNGTFVEDQRVSEVTLLDGNTITVGRTTIMYWDGITSDGEA